MKLNHFCLIATSVLLAISLVCYLKSDLFSPYILKIKPLLQYSSVSLQSTTPEAVGSQPTAHQMVTTQPTPVTIKENTLTPGLPQNEHKIVSKYHNTVTTHEVTASLPRGELLATNPTASYMLALHTAEQLTNGVSHFVEFLNMARQWNLTGVEPLVYGSRIFALRSMHPRDVNGSMYYHQLLNISSMRDKLNECFRQKYPMLDMNATGDHDQLFVPLREFLMNSKRAITLVYFPKHMVVIRKDVQSTADRALGKLTTITECTETLKRSGVSENVEVLLNQELIIEGANDSLNFRVIQAFCVPKIKISLVKIREYILSKIHRDKSQAINASIVFISWQGRFTRTFTDMDTLHRCRLPINPIAPNQLVISKSDQFLQSLGLKKLNYIGIHIRFEKLFATAFKYYENDSRHYLDCCMLRLNAVLKQVKKIHNLTSEGSTLLFHDYGRYGTDVCQYEGGWKSRSICVNESQHLLSLLNETRASEFDPVEFDAPQNSGFVSLVEGLALAGGQILVVVGGGGFQISVTDRFKSTHRNAVYYSLCTAHEKLPSTGVDTIKECTH